MRTWSLRIFTEPQQGATYDDLLAVARTAEDLGYGAFFRSDHYLGMGTRDSRPTDAWVTLAGLARDTNTIRLGTLMTSATFRYPGPLAISVAQVDQMSGGRVELGIGAGWFEAEHTAYGIPFLEVRERFERLEETLAIVTGLWATPTGERFAFDGKHYRVADSRRCRSRCSRRGLVGERQEAHAGAGGSYADEFNVPPSTCPAAMAVRAVRDVRAQGGRDPSSLTCSNAPAVLRRRRGRKSRGGEKAIGREVAELRENGLAGSPAEVVDRIGRYAEQGRSVSSSRCSTSATSTT